MRFLNATCLICLFLNVVVAADNLSDSDFAKLEKIPRNDITSTPIDVVIKMRDGRILSGMYTDGERMLEMRVGKSSMRLPIDFDQVVDWRRPASGSAKPPVATEDAPVDTAKRAKRDLAIMRAQLTNLERKRQELLGTIDSLPARYEKVKIQAIELDAKGYRTKAEYEKAVKTIMGEYKRLKDLEIRISQTDIPKIVSDINTVTARIAELEVVVGNEADGATTSTISVAVAPAGTATPATEQSSVDAAIRCTVLIIGARAQGSGFTINADGAVMTNRHVVDGNLLPDGSLRVYYDAGISNQPILYAVSQRMNDLDVAILTPKAKREGVEYLMLASEAPGIGTQINVVGYPMANDAAAATKTTPNQVSVTNGRISSLRRTGSTIAFLGLDAKANHGNSGGPVVDVQRGTVVGILTLGIGGTEGDANVFAIPSTQLVLRSTNTASPTGK
jgi:hypothetical protein